MIAYLLYCVLLILLLWFAWNCFYRFVVKKHPALRDDSRRNLALTVTFLILFCTGAVGILGAPFVYEFPTFGPGGDKYRVLKVDSKTGTVIETRTMNFWGEWELPFDGVRNRYVLISQDEEK